MKSAEHIREEEIPIVDIARLGDGSFDEEIGHRLIWAATEVRFIYVKNHGIAQEMIESAREAALEFFHLPREQKLAVRSNRDGPRGLDRSRE